jgi:hypothetical protein
LTHKTRSGPGIAINDLSHIGPKKSIFLGKPLIIDLPKHLDMVLNALIIL